MSFTRSCPSCKNNISYKNKRGFENAIKDNRNCRKCSAIKNLNHFHEDIKSGKRENGFKGKSHSEISKSNISASSIGRTRTKSSIEKGKKSVSENGGPWNKCIPLKEQYILIHGNDSGLEKYNIFCKLRSELSSGSNNPMFGRPSPQGSGNGWSGWYKDEYFRSLHELCFLVNWIDRFNMVYENAEKKKYKIPYKFNGTDRNYFADYVIDGKYLVEVKPKRLWNTPQNISKFEAAREYCKENNLKFKVIDCGKLKEENLINLYETNQIKFSIRYEDKFKIL